MKKELQIWMALCVLFASSLACNLPEFSAQMIPGMATPNQTMTALFAPSPTPVSAVNLTLTALFMPRSNATQPAQPTQPGTAKTQPAPVETQLTPAPRDTQAAPAETLPPTLTSTPLPTFTPSLTPSLTPSFTITATPTTTLTATAPGIPVVYPSAVTVPVGGGNQQQPPPSESSATFAASFVNASVDGDWSEYANEYPASYVVYGSNNWSGPTDLNASFRVGWNTQYLFVAVKVIDDIYVQNASGDSLYKGDSLEILVDANLYNDYGIAALNGDDHQIGISPGRGSPGGVKEAFQWFPRPAHGISALIGAQSFGGGYRVEAAIPWSTLGVAPASGTVIGFALSVSDNDAVSNVQQTMVSSTPGRHLTNPRSWSTLVLR